MAYDSKTFGQSPFGQPANSDAPASLDQPASKAPGEEGPSKGPNKGAEKTIGGAKSSVGLASKFPTLSTKPATTPTAKESATDSSQSTSSSTNSKRKSSSRKSSSKTTRKSKKTKAAEAAKAEIEAAEAAIARRFIEEDKRAYLSLLQKTIISGLVWAVLRLSVYELSDNATAIVNIIVHPLVISVVAFATVIGLTFWLRYLLNDLARHTQKLQADAESEDPKNYRPTIEIVGDSLEYNPRLRKNFARLFDIASILICSLTSYLLVIGLTLAWQVK